MYYQGNLHKCLQPNIHGTSYGTEPENQRQKGLVRCEIPGRSSAKNGLLVHVVVALRPSHSIVFAAREQLAFLIPHNKRFHLLLDQIPTGQTHTSLSVRGLNFWQIRHSRVLKLFANLPRIVASELQWMVVSVFALQCSTSEYVLAGAPAGFEFGSGTECECPHSHQISVTITCRIWFQVTFVWWFSKSIFQILLFEGAGVSVSYLGFSDWPWETLWRVLSRVRHLDVYSIILMIFISYFCSSCGVYAHKP